MRPISLLRLCANSNFPIPKALLDVALWFICAIVRSMHLTHLFCSDEVACRSHGLQTSVEDAGVPNHDGYHDRGFLVLSMLE